ncbi:MAG: helix-turn-helix domain-containing protein [Caulobacteraceae bacterium]
MSVDASKWAWDLPIAPAQRLVLLCLADHAGNQDAEDWTCFPSQQRISTRTGYPLRSVERYVGELARAGIISVETPRKGGRLQVRHYVLHRGWTPPSELPADEAAPRECPSSIQRSRRRGCGHGQYPQDGADAVGSNGCFLGCDPNLRRSLDWTGLF